MGGAPRPPVLVWDVPIDDVTMDEAVSMIGGFVVSGRADRRTQQVATVNLDFLVNATRHRDLLTALQHCDLCVADGVPVLWLARLARLPLRARVTGVDLLPALAAASVAQRSRIHLFGGAGGVAQRAAADLRARFPGALITGSSGPPVSSAGRVDTAVIDELVAIDADILCVALGNPKQERFIEANRDVLRTPVMIGIGGTLDMLVGSRRRAPQWMQRTGLEWIFRAAQEPRRLGKRYALDAVVMLRRLPASLHARSRSRGVGQQLHGADGVFVLRESTSTDGTAGWSAAVAMIDAGQPVTVDVGGAAPISVEILAQLVDIGRRARRCGTRFDVVRAGGAGDPMAVALDAVGLTAHVVPARGDNTARPPMVV